MGVRWGVGGEVRGVSGFVQGRRKEWMVDAGGHEATYCFLEVGCGVLEWSDV